MDTKPVICTKQEENALEFANKHLELKEPCSIIGLADMGQEILYRECLERLNSEENIISLSATNAQEVKDLYKNLQNFKKFPVTVILHLATPEDNSFIVGLFDKLRLTYSTSFNFVIFSDINSVTEALINHKKSLTRSLFLLSPMDKSDTNLLLDSFSKRFDFNLSTHQKEMIYSLGTGYVGLTKTLFLLLKDNPKIELEPEKLMKNDSIIYRLKTILSPTEKTYEVTDFFEKFGITQNGTIRNPLLSLFLEKNNGNPLKGLHLIFTPVEQIVFNKLLETKNAIISREDIAQTLWQENSEEKYSDWAIDQTIHRIREKLQDSNSPYEIVTKKGEGFYLKDK